MAVVKIGQIKSTPVKALAYIMRADATQDGLWISTNAAVVNPGDWNAVARQFAETNARVGVIPQRVGGVLAHHIIQSFKPGERVTAQQAHEIGVKLAEEITGGQHEYVVATHLDKDHIHNHIIFSATNMVTGRKFRCERDTLAGMRGVSDGLCRDAGLSVLPSPVRASGRTFGELYSVLKGHSQKEYLRIQIDAAAARSRTWTEFERALELVGIETSRRGGRNGTVAFREESMGRAVRDWRLGEAYTEVSIMARIARSVVNRISVDESMIVSETRNALTVIVPGTGRALRLTVGQSQVVRHGRNVRIYLPMEDQHRLADRRGRLAMTVSTAGLYRWFAEPDVAGLVRQGRATAGELAQVKTWRESLDGLHQLQDQVNTKHRWTHDQPDLQQALTAASKRLAEVRAGFQLKLVAATELLADGGGRAGSLAVLQADLRIMERDIAQLKVDVGVLAKLTSQETKMLIAEKIELGMAARRQDAVNASEQSAQRQRLVDQDGDRETPGHMVARDGENDAQQTRIEDQRNDRDGGSGRDTGLSLHEQIEARLAVRRAERIHDESSDGNERFGRSR